MKTRIVRLARPAGALAALALGLLALSGCGSSPTVNAAAPPTPIPTLFVQVDQVSVAQSSSCWVMSAFHAGEGIYFRAKVFDASGKVLTKDDLQSVSVVLPNNQTLAMTYSGHPGSKPTDSFWGVLWKVPADYPTGTVQYSVTATANDGRTGKWVDWNVASSQLQIL